MASVPVRSQQEAIARSVVPASACLGEARGRALKGGQAGGTGVLSGRGCVVCAGGVAGYAMGAT